MSTLADLRSTLFATLTALQDKDAPMAIDRAQAVSAVAGRIIDTARVEIDFIKATGSKSGSGFIPLPAPTETEEPTATGTKTVAGAVTTHRMR